MRRAPYQFRIAPRDGGMVGDAERCREMPGDAGRCREMPGDGMIRKSAASNH